MKRLIMTFMLLFSSYTQAELSLQLDASKIQMGQTFHLTLILDEPTSSALPDLTPLQADFKIVGTERSTSYNIINGKTSSTNQWIILLTPKRTGMLTIPPIEFGQAQTKATTIEVTDGKTTSASSSDTQKDVMLLTSVSNEHPYVNEQVIYTVKLYNSQRLLDATYQAPTIENALLISLGDSRRYQTSENGRLYTVEEQQYAIFPQKSGELTIRAPAFSALIYNGLTQQINVRAPETKLTVKSIPTNYNGKDWLPAKEILLREKYDRNTNTLTQGSTLVRTVTLQATGLPAELLPALSFTSDDTFSVYTDKPKESNTLRQNDLLGSTTVKVTYLLNKPGKIVIPAQELPWFNTVTGKEEQARLPELIIEVSALPGSSAPVDKAIEEPAKQVRPQPLSTIEKPVVLVEHSSSAWWLAGCFALAWLITGLLWWRSRWVASSKKSRAKTLNQLHDACLASEPESAREALLQWAACQWPDAILLNLAEVANLTPDLKLKREINELAKALYNKGCHAWRGDELWRCIASYSRSNSLIKKSDKSLPPINPGS
ncbi:MAG: BatD family protein [Legionella sp.]|nr:BatD family protein [Legionella sp.]